MRIVLDTASFVAAVRSSDGAAGQILRLIFQGRVIPLMDLKLGLEYRDVALRPKHLAASGLTADEMLEVIEAVEAVAELVRIVESPRPMSTDPNDDMILDVAINGRAEAIVTYNIRHFAATGRRFGILVLSPGDLLRTMRKGDRNGN